MEDPLALGPDGGSYPWDMASKIAAKQRSPRLFGGLGSDKPQRLLSPQETRKILLEGFKSLDLNGQRYSMISSVPEQSTSTINKLGQGEKGKNRQGRDNDIGESRDANEENYNDGCVPSRLCPSTYNTTAPLYGVSLTSGRPVTIVQKFPDLLQQVVFQVCKTETCEVLQGECIQSYLPYLFLVIPLGPVTLTGQDYILIESGCVCQPKYARLYDALPPLPFAQSVRS